MHDIVDPTVFVKGRVMLWRVWPDRNAFTLPDRMCPSLPGVWRRDTDWHHNDVMYDWATIVAKLLSGDPAYQLGGMYLEYANVDDPGDPVSVPAFTRGDGVSYYTALADSPDRDYLRIPLVARSLSSNDSVAFPQGNVLRAFAQTAVSDSQGVHGKAFSDAANSKICGGALVAIVDAADRSRDLVYSRFYFPVEQQRVKVAGANMGLSWEIDLQ